MNAKLGQQEVQSKLDEDDEQTGHSRYLLAVSDARSDR